MNSMNPDANIQVAIVCGNEVRIYSELAEGYDRRQLKWVREFSSHGAAVLYAQEFEDAERASRARRQR